MKILLISEPSDNESIVVDALLNPDRNDGRVLSKPDEELFKIDSKFPPTNVRENDEEYTIEFLVPGLTPDQLQIEIDEDNVLTVSTDQSQTSETEGVYRRREFAPTDFSRSFQLPEDVTDDEIEVDYTNGILTLFIARLKEDEPVKNEENS